MNDLKTCRFSCAADIHASHCGGIASDGVHFHDLPEYEDCLLVFLAAGIYAAADLWHFSVECILAAARYSATITDGAVFRSNISDRVQRICIDPLKKRFQTSNNLVY